MAKPTDVSDFGLEIYAQMAPIADQDEQYDWALLKFCGAIGAMFKFVDDLARSSPVPWANMVDPDLCPVEGLSWLGQIVGVAVNTNLTELEQRNQIKNHLGWDRGKGQVIIDSISPYLTGTKTVIIQERDTSAYHFKVSTYSSETPPDTSFEDIYDDYATFQAFYDAFVTFEQYWLLDGREQIISIIGAVKPAPLQFTYSVISGSP